MYKSTSVSKSNAGVIGEFGWALATDGNGTTIVVEAYVVHKVHVFTRSGTTWTQEAALIPNGGLASNSGWPIAMDSTGTRAVVEDNDAHKTYIFA